jgi:uncharacterized membrane protein
MDIVHLHQFLRHAPLLGILIGAAISLVGWVKEDEEYQLLSLMLLLCFGLAVIPVYLTGGAAEFAVKELPGLSQSGVAAHQEAARMALVVATLLAGVSFLGIVWRRRAASADLFSIAVLVLALAATGLFVWAGTLGGQIRHPDGQTGSHLTAAHGEPAEGGRNTDE